MYCFLTGFLSYSAPSVIRCPGTEMIDQPPGTAGESPAKGEPERAGESPAKGEPERAGESPAKGEAGNAPPPPCSLHADPSTLEDIPPRGMRPLARGRKPKKVLAGARACAWFAPKASSAIPAIFPSEEWRARKDQEP